MLEDQQALLGLAVLDFFGYFGEYLLDIELQELLSGQNIGRGFFLDSLGDILIIVDLDQLLICFLVSLNEIDAHVVGELNVIANVIVQQLTN